MTKEELILIIKHHSPEEAANEILKLSFNVPKFLMEYKLPNGKYETEIMPAEDELMAKLQIREKYDFKVERLRIVDEVH